MGLGLSQVHTFDPNPYLQKLHGTDVRPSIAAGAPRVDPALLNNLLASPYKITPCGQSGLPVSELFPELGKVIDDVCVLRGCRHNSPIHAPAEYLATTGTQVGDRPSLGAWVLYGLGSENRNLPGFVVLLQRGAAGRANAWDAGFLPPRFQGTRVEP